jgi:ATP-grasp domain/L-amino acid ligase C-terminal domain 2
MRNNAIWAADATPTTIEGVPRLLLIAATTGYQVRVFADAARRLGVDLMLATDRCHMLDDPWGDAAIPVRFQNPGESVDVIAAAGPFDAIVAVGDRPTLLAAEAAARLGIRFHPPMAVHACHDKYLARHFYRAAGLPVPAFLRVRIDEDPAAVAFRAPYPCVLKPLALSGSRGVIRADNPTGFTAAFLRIRALLARPDVLVTREEQHRYLQVESFIPGREFALEGLVTAGRLQVLALFDKPDPLDGPFFEETIYITPSRESAAVHDALIAAAQTGIRALGLTHGPVHAEMRYNREGVWILEIAARPIGGLCARALEFDGRTPLEDVIIRHALGEDVSRARLDGPASGVMMIPIPRAGIYAGVDGAEDAGAEVIITAKEGQKLEPLPEGSSYLGFIFARGGSPAEVERALRESHRRLHFRITTALDTLRPSNAAAHSPEEEPPLRQRSTDPSAR